MGRMVISLYYSIRGGGGGGGAIVKHNLFKMTTKRDNFKKVKMEINAKKTLICKYCSRNNSVPSENYIDWLIQPAPGFSLLNFPDSATLHLLCWGRHMTPKPRPRGCCRCGWGWRTVMAWRVGRWGSRDLWCGFSRTTEMVFLQLPMSTRKNSGSSLSRFIITRSCTRRWERIWKRCFMWSSRVQLKIIR